MQLSLGTGMCSCSRLHPCATRFGHAPHSMRWAQKLEYEILVCGLLGIACRVSEGTVSFHGSMNNTQFCHAILMFRG